ncbi:MAG: hypothetical protein E6Q97_00030 [Desulfurellales bacterium]|nr:MAG: hypothetical protein E6Q97_00030 [Desulfurellales bacterium]
MTTKKDQIAARITFIQEQSQELLHDMRDMADHTFEIDSLRERVKEIEADTRELADMIDCALTMFENSIGVDAHGGNERLLFLLAIEQLRKSANAYKREHGGKL